MYETNPLQRLTIRELEVLKLMSEGWRNKYIEETMFLAMRTVNGIINRMFSKLGVAKNSRVNPRVTATLIYLKYKESV